jgi:hypothetical protein
LARITLSSRVAAFSVSLTGRIDNTFPGVVDAAEGLRRVHEDADRARGRPPPRPIPDSPDIIDNHYDYLIWIILALCSAGLRGAGDVHSQEPLRSDRLGT